MDVTTFNQLRQKEDETAMQFKFRLQQMAKRTNETNPAMIRTRYIEGLRDKDLRERAYVDGIPLDAIVRMATRKEAIATTTPSVNFPWTVKNGRAVEVAAVAGPGTAERWTSRPWEKDRSASGQRPPANTGRTSQSNTRSRESGGGDRGDKCPSCGVKEHRGPVCPAKDKKCYKCGRVGHFEHVCRRAPSGVRVVGRAQLDEVRDGNDN